MVTHSRGEGAEGEGAEEVEEAEEEEVEGNGEREAELLRDCGDRARREGVEKGRGKEEEEEGPPVLVSAPLTLNVEVGARIV